jgi:hypothetical protein
VKFKLIFILVISTNAHSNFEYSGKLSLNHKQTKNETFRSGIELELNNKYSFNGKRDDFGLVLSPEDTISLNATIDYNQNSFTSEKVSLRPKQFGYKKYISAKQSIYIGDEVVIWGKAEEINPVDVWNADDYSQFLTIDKKSRKKSRTMAIYEINLEKNKIEAIIGLNDIRSRDSFSNTKSPLCNLHCNSFSKQNIRNSFSKLGYTVNFNKTETKGIDFGLRFSSTVDDTNIAFSYYHGAERFPYYSRKYSSPTHITFTPYQLTSTSVGTDLSTSFSSNVLFFEAKYQIEKPFILNVTSPSYSNDKDGLLLSDEYSWIIGIERSVQLESTLNIQYYKKGMMKDLEDVYNFGGNEIITVGFRNTYLDDTKIEFNLVFDQETTDYSKEIDLTYSHSDNYTLNFDIIHYYSKSNESLFSGLDQHEIISTTLSYNY